MTGLAKVNDVIEHGQPIPGNVVRMFDEAAVDDRSWRRVGPGRFEYYDSDEDRVVCEATSDLARDFADCWPMTVVEVDPEPQPAEPDVVHYFISEFGPSGATLCGIGIEEDGDLSTTSEAGEGTCRDCRIALDEEVAGDATVIDFVVPCRDLKEPDGVMCPGEVRYGPGDQQAACTVCGGWRGRYAPEDRAPNTTVVLRLPEVPEGTVALIDRNADRWTPQQQPGRWRRSDGMVTTYPLLLENYGPVTVEFAPPREPRTWPKIDPLPDDISAKLTVKGISGPWLRVENVSGGVALYRWRGTGQTCTLLQLRALGAVTEVIEP